MEHSPGSEKTDPERHGAVYVVLNYKVCSPMEIHWAFGLVCFGFPSVSPNSRFKVEALGWRGCSGVRNRLQPLAIVRNSSRGGGKAVPLGKVRYL